MVGVVFRQTISVFICVTCVYSTSVLSYFLCAVVQMCSVQQRNL